MEYPLGWIVVLAWVCLCLLMIVLVDYLRYNKNGINLRLFTLQEHDIQDKPLIAQPNVYQILSQEEKLKYRSIQEIRLIKDDILAKRSYCVRLWNLFKINMMNDHLWLGICFQHYGTSYTHTQRIAILMVRLLTSMAVAALFYARAKDSTIGDISLSFCAYIVHAIYTKCEFCETL